MITYSAGLTLIYGTPDIKKGTSMWKTLYKWQLMLYQ